MSIKVLYATSVIAFGGRDGRAATTDGSFEVKLARPKEFGGNGAGNTPEQLFAAGYAACFLSSLQVISSQGGPKVPPDATVKATVGMGSRSEGFGYGLDVALEIAMPGAARSDAEALVEKAHQVCPYSMPPATTSR